MTPRPIALRKHATLHALAILLAILLAIVGCGERPRVDQNIVQRSPVAPAPTPPYVGLWEAEGDPVSGERPGSMALTAEGEFRAQQRHIGGAGLSMRIVTDTVTGRWEVRADSSRSRLCLNYAASGSVECHSVAIDSMSTRRHGRDVMAKTMTLDAHRWILLTDPVVGHYRRDSLELQTEILPDGRLRYSFVPAGQNPAMSGEQDWNSLLRGIALGGRHCSIIVKFVGDSVDVMQFGTAKECELRAPISSLGGVYVRVASTDSTR